MNVTACGRVLVSEVYSSYKVDYNVGYEFKVNEVNLKFSPKEASNSYKSAHFYSYVFRKPSSDFLSLFA